MADKHRYSIQLGWDDHLEKLQFAVERGLGVEIAAFATGPGLHDHSTRRAMERGLAAALKDFPHRRSFHGAFIDITLHSQDPDVAAVARQRLQRDMETASRLGCERVVFHTGYNPLVPAPNYEGEFLERHAAFWPVLAEAWPGLEICLENLWERSPDLLARLLRTIGHPRVGLCLDVAHAHVYGDVGIEFWFEMLQDRIIHMHWNDNQGDTDSHLAIGAGSIPWKHVLAATATLARGISVVLELRSLAAIRQSLSHIALLKSGE